MKAISLPVTAREGGRTSSYCLEAAIVELHIVQEDAVWTPENWCDGYVDSRGRFRVVRPDYPRAYKGGYALRAHVVWWLHHGEPHPAERYLHHKNGDKLDDRLENLELVEPGAHCKMHNVKPMAERTCRICGRKFLIRRWALNESGRSRGIYCSRECFYESNRTPERRAAQAKVCRANFANRWRRDA